MFNWAYDADEAIKTINIQYSADGVHFSNLVDAGVRYEAVQLESPVHRPECIIARRL